MYRHFTALPQLVETGTTASFAALATAMEAELARCYATGNVQHQAWQWMCGGPRSASD